MAQDSEGRLLGDVPQLRSNKTVNAPASCRPANPQPSPLYFSRSRDAAGADAAEARLAMIKRFGMCALALLLAGGALTGIVALRAIAVFHTSSMNIY
jgi:hypothetical protein